MASNSTPPTDRILRNQRFHLYPKEAWYCLAVFIFVVACFQWGSFLHSKYARRGRGSEMASREHEPGPASIRHAPSLRRVPLAFVNAYRVLAFRWTVEIGQSYTLNMAEVFVTIAYLAFLLIWEFINTTDLEGNRLNLSYWSHRAGILAASQLPLVTALGTKNNIVSLVTGVSADRLNYVHRVTARTCMILLWIHGGSEVYAYSIFKATLHRAWLRLGIAALVALSLLCIVSVRPFRQGAYEFFFYMHLSLVLIFLLGAYYHAKEVHYSYWIWPSFVFWALDRFIRVCRLVAFNHSYFGWKSGSGTMDATTELLCEHVVRLRLRRPPHFHWAPGQTAYLIMPSVSRLPFEAHPFTIASFDSSLFVPVPTEGKAGSNEQLSDKHHQDELGSVSPFWKELVFLINVRKGFTKRLQEVAATNGKIKVFVDGPYGPSPNLGSYDISVLVAGGSGVSYTLPVLLDVIECVRNGKSDCRRVVFIWAVREADHIHWINEALVKAVQLAPSSLTVAIYIHLTGPSAVTTPLGEVDSLHTASVGHDGHEPSVKSKQSILYMPGVTVEQGRPDLDRMLKEEVMTTIGRMSVSVCGSQPIARAVRNALRFPVSSPSNILRGGPSVTLHVESFGYA
ncbi:hypothetical protein BV22DRAFT_1021612 [Leucogyrophana mollusca]|uniref:Uncharacterized protein n=1 Tax=Leucogyrophana mollusca TaxID=85980 RepID=A0ACB8B354_9AGAM|nr:hypothetical protein BV22DRAFT_1021612 [Leucogyrophana mollusca]